MSGDRGADGVRARGRPLTRPPRRQARCWRGARSCSCRTWTGRREAATAAWPPRPACPASTPRRWSTWRFSVRPPERRGREAGSRRTVLHTEAPAAVDSAACPAGPPWMAQKERTVRVRENALLNLSCEASGHPRPAVSWSVGGKVSGSRPARPDPAARCPLPAEPPLLPPRPANSWTRSACGAS